MAKAKKGFAEGYKTYDTSNGYGNPDQWQNAFEFRMNYKILTTEEQDKGRGLMQPLYDAMDMAELKKAYYKLMLQYHPDKAGNTEENTTLAQLINDTYFKLKMYF